MAIVAQGSGWHVESFVIPQATVNDGSLRVDEHTLEKAGAYLGSSIFITTTAAVGDSGGMMGSNRNVDNSQLTIGQNITVFESLIINDSGSNNSVGENVMIWIRDHR